LGPDPFTRKMQDSTPNVLSLSQLVCIADLGTLLCIEGYKASRKTSHGRHGARQDSLLPTPE